ncbi:MAG: polyprenyl synthetase family protein [Eubacteriales bacterium]|nr:polyprenyl synthetase family protein [Eubacteriales bacterium]
MIKQAISEYANKAETALYKLMPETDIPQKTVCEAMKYSIEAGGKRLRPVIMLMCAKILDLSEKDVMPFACALEMIHTYSLIHDDLPAMDNDDLRRGKPTNHKVFGEAMAILAGDSLLNFAAEIVSGASYTVPADRVLNALSELYKASGIYGMIGGQVLDIESEGKDVSIDELRRIHLLKTGALIRAAGRIPCVLSGLDKDKTDAVTAFCDNLGVAFQICDDLLDVYGDSKELGKNTGSDIANNKSTYVSIFGREESLVLMNKHTEMAIESISVFGDKANELTELARYLTNRKN